MAAYYYSHIVLVTSMNIKSSNVVDLMERGKKMKKSVSEKIMLSGKEKKKINHDQSQRAKKNRLLITVNVLGSSGPLRLLVNEDDTVSAVIGSSLKLYARGGRLPVLGSNFKNFALYPSIAGLDAMNSSEAIGSSGGRKFVLCKKQNNQQTTEATRLQGDNRGWKLWLSNLKESFKI